jgi:hypothetical protein
MILRHPATLRAELALDVLEVLPTRQSVSLSVNALDDVELRPVFPASSSVDVAEVPAAGKRVLASFIGPLGKVRRMVEAAAARGVA